MEDSRFFELRDHSENEFAEVLADLSTDGVYQHADQKLQVTAPGGRLVNVAAGRAIVQGFWYRLPVFKGVAISPNPAGLIRYDRIVLRLDRAGNRVILATREGVPGSGVPALQRSIGGPWELSLASVQVGPGVTNIATTDISDERGYASVCGWAGGKAALGPENVEGIPNFIAISPNDPNTGWQWTSPDRIDILCGAKPVGTFSVSGNSFGAFDMVTVIRAGGTVGAPQERIYVDNDFILIGRDGSGAGTGVSQIQLGTSTRTAYVTIGHATTSAMYANIMLNGVVTFTTVPQNNLINVNVTDGFYTGFNIQNTAGTKSFKILLATGGAAAFGASGDVSVYTDGSAAGRLILGTQGVARVWIGPSSIAFGGGQPARTGGFSFQQATNDQIGGIRLYHTNTAHNLQWFADVTGRHVWGINDVPQMWLFTEGQFTVGGTAPKGAGFSFQQYANNSSWGMRIYHSNASNHFNFWMDDPGRMVIAVNSTPVFWANGGSVFTFGGATVRASGINYQQTTDAIGYGHRLWHTNTSSHLDFCMDNVGRIVLANNDVGRVFIAANGAITFGTVATDAAALHITATFGDAAASGIRLTNGPNGFATWWHRSDGVSILGSQSTQVWFHHAVAAFSPQTPNSTYLGYPGYQWAGLYVTNATISGNMDIAGNLTVHGTLTGAPSLPSDVSFNNLSVGGTATITNLKGSASAVYPEGNYAQQFGGNGRGWSNIFSQVYWKPGGGNGFNDTNGSDDRLKLDHAFRPYDRGLDVVLGLHPTYFQYTGEYGTPEPGEEFHGFRAQELLSVAPEMVVPHLRRVDPTDLESPEEEFLTVNSSDLPYMLTLAVQELHAQIEALRADIADLQKGKPNG